MQPPRITYEEALDFLYRSLPMYQRQGGAAYKANLDNTLRLDKAFGHPHRRFATLHVAGTNGKGSVSHMLAAVFRQAGYRTGLYTSPHLLDFRERIRIDGEKIPRERVLEFVENHRDLIRDIEPSFFEMTVAMAFDHFARERVDVAVVETGMGGRLDSTNIVDPELSVITNISKDHTEFLGDTPEAIAREKGGIIKPGRPVVLGPMDAGTRRVLEGMAREAKAPCFPAGDRWEAGLKTLGPDGLTRYHMRALPGRETRILACDLAGTYQKENLMTVLTALEVLSNRGWTLPREDVERGLSRVGLDTGLLGRWQTLGFNPRLVCDTAHNEAGVKAVVEQIRDTPWKNLHLVWGCVRDKDAAGILQLLPGSARYYYTRPSVERAMPVETLAGIGAACGRGGQTFPRVAEAVEAARAAADRDDMVFVGGSTFVVADLLSDPAWGLEGF
ncbi:MAG: folylpolyglutamate synthase/dihydrofolate synthase family protein [Bacteroidales bacterium]